MLGSTTDPFPDFDSEGSLKTSGSNRLAFKKAELSEQFYLTIVGQEYSEYTIGVIVSR
jgi:hypothetical protein